jgi:hypothetical protein
MSLIVQGYSGVPEINIDALAYSLKSMSYFAHINTRLDVCTETMHCLAAAREHLLGQEQPSRFVAVAMAHSHHTRSS